MIVAGPLSILVRTNRGEEVRISLSCRGKVRSHRKVLQLFHDFFLTPIVSSGVFGSVTREVPLFQENVNLFFSDFGTRHNRGMLD